MIIKTELLKDVCGEILTAVDSSEVSTLTETLQLKTEGTYLYFSVTNREYFVKVRLDLGETVDFNATVKATLFLKLIPQITTDTIELTVTENSLNIVGNGKYKLPLIFDSNTQELLELPEIEINNITNDFYINSSILTSILKYNSKEIEKGVISRPVQNLYYVDEFGALTFTSGACINSFTLSEPVKLLLGAKLVKLFKLFKSGDVHCVIGQDAISNDMKQTKIKLETENTVITAVFPLNNEALMAQVPVAKIRDRANKVYPYEVSFNKDEILRAINRLMLLSNSADAKKSYTIFECDKDQVVIYDANKENKETIYYSNQTTISETYTMALITTDLKTTIECAGDTVNMKFGDCQAVVITMGNIKNVVPEVRLK